MVETRRAVRVEALALHQRQGITSLNVEDFHDGWLTISKAFKGPNSNAPIRGTKVRKVRRLPVDEALRDWIERYTDPRDRFGNVPLFPNPAARNRERRWSGTESEEIRGVRWRGGRDSNPHTFAPGRGISL